jgi:thioredoxin 2
MMAPAFEAAASEFEPRVRLAKVDTDQETALGTQYNIRSIPTLVLFKDGREAARLNGALPAGELRRWIGAHL